MNIQTVGVVGCGQMGAGIAEICAKAGYAVIVREPTEELLQRGMGRIQKSLDRAASKGKLSRADADAAWGRIRGTTALADFGACDLVVEAVPEDMALKKETFAALDRICPPHTIIGSNTSCLCVTEMASATGRGDRVLGLYPLSPENGQETTPKRNRTVDITVLL